MKQLHKNFVIYLVIALFGVFSFSSCGNKRSDEDIQKDVSEGLTRGTGNDANGARAYSNVNATVKDGVVTLDGQCEGENCADSVVSRVNGIDGVKDVQSNIRQTQAPTDLTLRTSVQSIISKYQGVQADVADGVVVLRGSILRDQVQPLMNELSTLQARKIDNQLAIQ